MSKNTETIASAVMREFGLQYTEERGEQTRSYYSYQAETIFNGISIEEFEHLAFLSLRTPKSTMDFHGKKITIKIDDETMSLVFSRRKKLFLTLPLEGLIKHLQKDWGERSTAIPLKEMTLSSQGKGLKVQVIIQSIGGSISNDDSIRMDSLRGLVLLGPQ